MTVATIIAKALQSIPEKVRFALLALFALVVVCTQVLGYWVEIPAQLWQSYALIGSYFGVQSVANVPSVVTKTQAKIQAKHEDE